MTFGGNPARPYDIVFLALARDCAKTIPNALRALELFDASGLLVKAVVGENGSRDETPKLLQHHLVEVVDTSAMGHTASRLERMALGRQIVADYARGMDTRAFAVVDLDEWFLGAIKPDHLRSVLDRLGEVFAVAATSAPTYYDLLAYEGQDGDGFLGLDDQIRELQRNPAAYYRLFRDTIYPAQERLTSAADVRCTSAFNGVCIYDADAYRAGSYQPTAPGPWICEHITFNRSVAEATGRAMVVDPGLVLPMPAEHGRRTFPGFVWQRLQKLPSKVAAKLGA